MWIDPTDEVVVAEVLDSLADDNIVGASPVLAWDGNAVDVGHVALESG